MIFPELKAREFSDSSMQPRSHSDGTDAVYRLMQSLTSPTWIQHWIRFLVALLKDRCLLLSADVYRKLPPKYQDQHKDNCL